MDYTKFVPLTALVSAHKAEIAANAKAQAEEEAREEAAHQSLMMVVTAMAIDCLSETLGVHRHDIAEIIEVLDWRDQWGRWDTARRPFESPYGTIDLPGKITAKFLVGHVSFYTDLFYQAENTVPYYKLTKGAEPFCSYGRWPKKFSSFADAVIWAQERSESILEEERRETERDTKGTATREAQQRANEDERDAVLNILEEYPESIYLLKAFGAMLRRIADYEEQICAANDGWDRSSETAASIQGDLVSELEHVKNRYRREQDARQRAEDELADEQWEQEFASEWPY